MERAFGSLIRINTVAEYVVDRLADLGIGHVFGVPGDFAFPIDDAVVASDRVAWIGCSNELNAAYAADGYGRIHGAAMPDRTDNVGAAAALAGVMGDQGGVRARLSRRRIAEHPVGAELQAHAPRVW